MENGVLLETKSGKFLELVPGNAIFHFDKERASLVSRAVFDDAIERNRLLDHHNVDWYAPTIEFVGVEPSDRDFILRVTVPSLQGVDLLDYEADLYEAGLSDSTLMGSLGGSVLTIYVTRAGDDPVRSASADICKVFPDASIELQEFL